jgi:hypothetical protein
MVVVWDAGCRVQVSSGRACKICSIGGLHVPHRRAKLVNAS